LNPDDLTLIPQMLMTCPIFQIVALTLTVDLDLDFVLDLDFDLVFVFAASVGLLFVLTLDNQA